MIKSREDPDLESGKDFAEPYWKEHCSEDEDQEERDLLRSLGPSAYY